MIKLLSATQNHRPIFVVMAVFTGAILSTLFVRMFSISLADLRGVFGLDVAQGSWLNVALNIAQLISMTLVPWFMVVYGAEKILISASFILFLLWISGSHNRTTDWFWRTFYCSFYDWILYRSLFADDDFISLKKV